MKHPVSALAIVKWLALSLMAWGFVGSVHAHSHQIGQLLIVHPYATATVAGQPTGAVYLTSIRNRGSDPDRLVSASSEVAKHVALHEMQVENDIMRMREVPFVEIPAKSEITMKHSSSKGYHLMLEGLKRPLNKGDRFSVRLKFERAGTQDIEVWVEGMGQDSKHQH